MVSQTVLAAGPALRPTYVLVDLDAIAHNVAITRSLAGDATLCAVVKADAYGHGALPVARKLVAAGVEQLAVATVEEGSALRAGGISCPILVLAGNFAGAYEAVVTLGLTPVVGIAEDLAGLAQAAAKAQQTLDIHVELDTGMARLGVDSVQLPQFIDDIAAHSGLKLVGVMSHFSHSDVTGDPATTQQIERLNDALAQVRDKLPHLRWRHIVNSGGLISAPQAPHDMVRCGLCLYGVQPIEGAIPNLRPALSWHTRIVALRQIQAEQAVSYGARWRALRPSTIATLPVGYADGYPRALGNRAQVLIGGRRAPVIGTICMDLCMVDVTDIPHVALGQPVTLLGSAHLAPSAAELAAWGQTISWEILSRIGPRVPRTYVSRS